MRISPLFLAVFALAACPGPEDEDPAEPVCDGEGCEEALATSCPSATLAMQGLDVPAANAAYASCLQADATDSASAFGVALTDFLLIGDWSSTEQGLQWCSQSTNVSEEMFGPNGLALEMDDAYNGTSTLSARYDPENGGAETELTSLAAPELILTEIWDDGDDARLSIDVQTTIGGGGAFYLWLPLNDVYRDGSRTALQAGQTYDIGRMTEGGDYALRFRAACGEPGSSCDGYAQSGEPEGTITFTDFGNSDGSTVAFEIDATFPAYCDDTPCPGSHRVVGSVSDTLNDLPDVEELPFGDVDPACFQSGNRCDYDTEFLSVIADICDVSSFDAAHGMLGDMANELDAVADAFDMAGADAGLVFTLPTDRMFFAHSTRTFNQADALLMASSMRALSATARLGAQYDWLDPDSSPDDMASTYGSSYYSYQEDECVGYSTTGVSSQELVAAADGHLGNHVANADFDGVRDGLTQAFTSAKQAMNSETTEPGIIAPTTNDGAYQVWLRALEADVDAVIASLGGSDVELPSSPAYELGLGGFFASPTDRASLLADIGADSFLTLYDGQCRDSVEGNEDLGEWLAEGGDFGRMPADWGSGEYCNSDSDCVIRGEVCNAGYNECEYAIPHIFNEDAWDSIFDDDGVPVFFGEQAQVQVDEWAY